jgi:outer membrane lipopolysaccharide assembly protein LptE/RlpB
MNMHLRLALLTALVGLLSGCQYQWGSLMHPQIQSMAVGRIQNATREPQLEGILRAKLAERIMTDGSLRLTPVDEADAILEANVRSVEFSALAATKQRDEAARQEDKDEYQTSLYRATVTIEVTVIVPGKTTPLVETRTVTGVGDFNPLPDLQVARKAAYDLALRDAAAKAIAEVTEAW